MNRPTPTALVVLHAFGRYNRGDVITDPATIQAILAGGNSNLVVGGGGAGAPPPPPPRPLRPGSTEAWCRSPSPAP